MRNFKTRSSLFQDVMWHRLVVGYHFKDNILFPSSRAKQSKNFLYSFFDCMSLQDAFCNNGNQLPTNAAQHPRIVKTSTLLCQKTEILQIIRFITFINWYRSKTLPTIKWAVKIQYNLLKCLIWKCEDINNA